jgi:hypothetical protein
MFARERDQGGLALHSTTLIRTRRTTTRLSPPGSTSRRAAALSRPATTRPAGCAGEACGTAAPSWARRVCVANPQLTRPLEQAGRRPGRNRCRPALAFAECTQLAVNFSCHAMIGLRTMGLRRVIGAGASDTRVTSACEGESRQARATAWRVRDQASRVLGFAFGDEDELCARVSQPSRRLPLPGQWILRASTLCSDHSSHSLAH